MKKIVKRITAWSFSRWNDYAKCPFLAKCKHVDKMREPENQAMQNGTIVHQLAEQHTRGDLKKCPPELSKFKNEFVQLRAAKASTEKEWAFTQAWAPTGWFAPDAWVRIKVDCHVVESVGEKDAQQTTVKIVDHKTGRERPDHALQRSLYAIAAFIMYPDAATVVAQHWYLDHGATAEEVFTRAMLAGLIKQWEQRTRAMLSDVRFAPKPSGACKWCHFRKENGGPCKF